MALTDDLISYWKLDESSGNASDSVGSVTLTNNNTVGYATGKINNCADFGSSNSNKSLTTTNKLGIDGGEVSISAWVNCTTLPANNSDRQHAVDNGNNTSKVHYGVGVIKTSDKVHLFWNRGRSGVVDNTVLSTITPDTGTWYHLVMTYDGTDVRGYINGELDKSVASSGNGSGNPGEGTTIGCYVSGSSEFFSGKVDEVGVWDRALSSSEVTALYNSGNGKQYPFSDAYTLVCAVGTFTLTGINATLKSARKLAMAVGSFTLTGIDVAFKMGKGLVAEAGNFVLTGKDATLKSARTMVASVGEFTLTGIDATFKKVITLVASVGRFILTSINVRLRSTGWGNDTKPTTSWTQDTKPSDTWTNDDK
jgi:hypothetical protein